MPRFYVVVDDLSDWSPYYPSQDVITFEDYLAQVTTRATERVRVVNLCRNYKYLGRPGTVRCWQRRAGTTPSHPCAP